jgi:hypothetical protein
LETIFEGKCGEILFCVHSMRKFESEKARHFKEEMQILGPNLNEEITAQNIEDKLAAIYRRSRVGYGEVNSDFLGEWKFLSI